MEPFIGMPPDAARSEEIEALLRRQAITETVAYVERLAGQGMTPAFAQWLFARIDGWYLEGHFDAMQRVYALLEPFMAQPWEIWHSLGYRADLLGEFALAKTYYERTLARRPDHAYTALALAQLAMMHSGFREGRGGYDIRFIARRPDDNGPDWRHLPIARWQGEPLRGKRLYLWVEQGVGDVLMFMGFLPHLLAEGPAHITLGVYDKLIPLLARAFPGITVESLEHVSDHVVAPALLQRPNLAQELAAMPPEQRAPLEKSYARALHYKPYDYAAPIGDMMVHGMAGYIPARHPAYLKADPALVREMEEALPPRAQARRVGISWFTANRREGAIRSIPLAAWAPILRTPHCRFFSLQHHVSGEEIARVSGEQGFHIEPLSFDPTADVERLAALIACMDVVITIDNSNAHLAGALGIPTWMLLPKGHDFRWPVQPDGGTLWYQSVEALRQTESLDWEPVIAQIARRLAA